MDLSKKQRSNDADQVNLSLVLRTLRLTKTNLYTSNKDGVIAEDKRRRIISLIEVANHDVIEDCWIILYDRVYDVTHFLDSVSIIIN